jgi:predicted PhzF superfamily epimerase YddE/YHI9
MMELQFVTLDVFTDTRLEGNPLAVVQVPAALRAQLPQTTKQKIASEFHLSETVFLHEAAETQAQDHRDFDIFTIDSELPFAGHPTVGTAVLLKQQQRQEGGGPAVTTLVAKCGPIAIEDAPGPSSSSSGSQYVRAKIPHDVRLHRKTLADVLPDAEQRARLLASDAEIREAELSAPAFSVVKGMTFVMVRLPSLEALARVDAAAMARLDFAALPPLLDEGAWRGGFVGRYYYVDVTPPPPSSSSLSSSSSSRGEGERFLRTRMMEIGFEDPATGSAASCLAAFLTLTEGGEDGEKVKKASGKFHVTQGVEMGRRSEIVVETTVHDDGKLKDIWLGGTAVVVMKGTITVDT